jgi:hypothetical protein
MEGFAAAGKKGEEMFEGASVGRAAHTVYV